MVTWRVPWDLLLQSLNAPEIIMLQSLLSVLVGEEGQGWETRRIGNGKGIEKGGAEMGGLRKWEAG